MNLKRGFKRLSWLFIALIIVFLLCSICSNLALAQQDEISKIKKAYTWLQGSTAGKWANLNTEQHVFSLIALQSKLTASQINSSYKALLQKSYNNGTCWPGPTETCNLVDTALAKIALITLAKDQTKVDEWLLNHTKPYTEGNWFLQLTQPSNNEVRCLLSYESLGQQGQTTTEITISKNGIIGGNLGDCFSNATYWLQLNANCAEKEFTILCNDSIMANFLFKKDDEWFVSSKVETAPALENLSIKLATLCVTPQVSQAKNCDYKATLWTAYAFALANQEEIVKSFLPYLIMNANAQENQKYLPEAFLYKLTAKQSYANKLAQMQKTDGTWLASGSNNKYYDTALVAIMTQGSVGNILKTKETLLREQKTDGSWDCSNCNNIRETAMILVGIWPNFEWRSSCELEGYSCVANCTDAGGSPVTLDCFSNLECCNISFSCEQKYGICKASCSENETQLSYSCSSGVCCKDYSKALCVAEIKGERCNANQKCLDSQSRIIPFIYASDTAYCCKGSCSTATLSCSEANGVYCDPSAGYSCLQNKWIQATDTVYCCEANYCSQLEQTCQQKYGEICSSDQDCKDGILVEAADTNGQATCCIQGGKCIPKTCNYEKCNPDESCVGSSYETFDALVCCRGQCLKSCAALGGTICNATMKCKGTTKKASDTSQCCIGKCQKKAKFPTTILIIIIIIVIILAVLFYLIKTGKIKLKGKPKPAMPRIEYGFGMQPRAMPPRGLPPAAVLSSQFKQQSEFKQPVQPKKSVIKKPEQLEQLKSAAKKKLPEPPKPTNNPNK